MTNKWKYDGSIDKFPIKKGEVWSLDNGSKVMVNDLYEGLPDFMKEADFVFVDPPWNLSAENSFRTKADLTSKKTDFQLFLDKLFEHIETINPHTLVIEFGIDGTKDILDRIENKYKYIDIYQSTYYKKSNRKCNIIRASKYEPILDYSEIDEMDIISLICEKEKFNCIADICMGRGSIGIQAFKNNRKFLGTELNPKRLAVMINKIDKMGGKWTNE